MRYVRLTILCIIGCILLISCGSSTHYECQCYRYGVRSNTYEIDLKRRSELEGRCHAVQQQNMEDTCMGVVVGE